MKSPPLSRLDLLLHPVRLRIVLALHGQTRTPRELAQALGDVPQASLYRHLGLLRDSGVVVVTGTRGRGPRAEQLLTAHTDGDPSHDDEVAALSPDDLRRHFSTWVGVLAEALEARLARGPIRPREEGTSFFLASAWLTDAEASALRADILERFRACDADPGPERRQRLLGYVAVAGEPPPKGDDAP